MDVDATYALMVAESSDLDERAVAATDLLVWMLGSTNHWERIGGRTITHRVIGDECKRHIFAALDRLAALEAP